MVPVRTNKTAELINCQISSDFFVITVLTVWYYTQVRVRQNDCKDRLLLTVVLYTLVLAGKIRIRTRPELIKCIHCMEQQQKRLAAGACIPKSSLG